MTDESVRDSLRAFAEAADDGFAEVLDEVVSEHRNDVPRAIDLETLAGNEAIPGSG